MRGSVRSGPQAPALIYCPHQQSAVHHCTPTVEPSVYLVTEITEGRERAFAISCYCLRDRSMNNCTMDKNAVQKLIDLKSERVSFEVYAGKSAVWKKFFW